MKKEIYIVRHGQTDLNRDGIVQGRGVDSSINETGIKQAEKFFRQYQHISFDKIYTSSLKRTWQTVHKFIESGVSWEKLVGLDEMDWGVYEGKPSTEITKAAFKKLLESWSYGNYNTSLGGGESPSEVMARQSLTLEYILSNPKEETILICMHGRAIRILLCLITGTELRYMDSFPHQNLSLYKISWENNEFKVLDFNNLAHIEAEIS